MKKLILLWCGGIFLMGILAVKAADDVTLLDVQTYGNFHAGGIVATISGDDNGNSNVALEWHEQGEDAFHPAHPLTRISSSYFAVAPATVGPTYILRNVTYGVGNTRTSRIDGYTASALKINSGYATPIGPLYLYHNTFYTDSPLVDRGVVIAGINDNYHGSAPDIGALEYGDGCAFDCDTDGDVDGQDLVEFDDKDEDDLAGFAAEFGRIDCD